MRWRYAKSIHVLGAAALAASIAPNFPSAIAWMAFGGILVTVTAAFPFKIASNWAFNSAETFARFNWSSSFDTSMPMSSPNRLPVPVKSVGAGLCASPSPSLSAPSLPRIPLSHDHWRLPAAIAFSALTSEAIRPWPSRGHATGVHSSHHYTFRRPSGLLSHVVLAVYFFGRIHLSHWTSASTQVTPLCIARMLFHVSPAIGFIVSFRPGRTSHQASASLAGVTIVHRSHAHLRLAGLLAVYASRSTARQVRARVVRLSDHGPVWVMPPVRTRLFVRSRAHPLPSLPLFHGLA